MNRTAGFIAKPCCPDCSVPPIPDTAVRDAGATYRHNPTSSHTRTTPTFVPALTMKPVLAVPCIAALVYRAWSHKSLTHAGIATAFLTAIAHTVHPWSVFFVLLATFFLAGSAVTKVCAVVCIRRLGT
jgi:hypothetical protein